MISVVLPVHNQQDLIAKVLNSLKANSSGLVKEYIIIIDGCTDNSEVAARVATENWPDTINIIQAPNVFEVKADNIGMKASTQPFCVLTQDDIVIEEAGYDARLLEPMMKWDNVFAVGGRMGLDCFIKSDGYLDYCNGASWTNLMPNEFAIRDVLNRGPLMLRRYMAEELNWLDEAYAPLAMDDCDICMRAYLEYGWLSGCYPIKFRSDLNWGTTRKNIKSRAIQAASELKNTRMFERKYAEALKSPCHSENRIV